MHRSHSHSSILSKVTAGLLAVAWVWPAITPAVADELRLGALLPMTGGLQSYGESSLGGIRLAVEEMNAAGGVNGASVVVIVGDTQTKIQPGIAAAKKLVDVENVAGIIGALSSGVTIPVAKMVTKIAGVTQISSASTSPEITNLDDRDFLFRTVPADAMQGAALAEIAKSKGLKTAAIVYLNNEYGKGLADTFTKNFKGKVTQSVAFEHGRANYLDVLKNASSGEAGSLLLIAYPKDGITILRQSIRGGFFKKYVFSDGMKSQQVIKSIGAKFLNGSYATAPQSSGKANSEFKKLYEKRFGKIPPDPFIDSAYDAALLLGLAALKAGKNERKAIQKALRLVANPPGIHILPGQFAKAKKHLGAGEDIDYVGAAGPQNFDAHGDVSGTYAHWEIKDGKIFTIKVFTPK